MPPIDAFSVDATAFDSGSFAEPSAFPLASDPIFASGDPGTSGDVPSNPASIASAAGERIGLGQANGSIEFRVIRSGSPVRRLRLTGNRYTFGSAEGCSIQLNDPTLRPMHAVLIRDVSRILIRAYSVPIELNDVRTTEANLRPGDVVRIGAYSFELLSSSLPPYDFATGPTHRALAMERSSHSLAAPMTEDPLVWREQLHREVAQWRARQAECDRREGRCADRESVLRSRESELWSRAEQLHRRESHLMSQESAALQIQEDYASKQQEVVRLRDEYRAKEQAFAARETELQSLQQEYRDHVSQASRQLQQSQQQAEAATQAVQRMRDQFNDLNRQLEELQNQQFDLQQQEQRQNDEHLRLREELESARDEAIDGKAEAEARRHEIENRIEELDAQLRQTQADCETERERADENETVAGQLRGQIDQLNESIHQASEEAARLREDYEQACDTIRSLEAIVEQGNQRGEMDRESWFGEAEQLRQSVEQLSVDLAQANGELSDLRHTNDQLTRSLEESTAQRDQARDELLSRPTQDAFELLRDQLDDANSRLAEIQREHDETLSRLDLSQQELELSQQELESSREEIASTRAELDSARQQLESSRQGFDSSTNELESSRQELESSRRELESSQQELEAFKLELESSQQELESSRQQLSSSNQELESSHEEIASSRMELEAAKQQLESAYQELESARLEKEAAQQWAADAEARLDAKPSEAPEPENAEESPVMFQRDGAFTDGVVTWNDEPETSPEIDATSSQEETSVEQAYPEPVADSFATSDGEAEAESETDQPVDDAHEISDTPATAGDGDIHWSAEHRQSADAPHFETEESTSWDVPAEQPQQEEFEATFDRAGGSVDDSWDSAKESVDQAIDQIEKGVDEAISNDFTGETDSVADVPDESDEESPAADATDTAGDDGWPRSDSSPWGSIAEGTDENAGSSYEPESDVTSPWDVESVFGSDVETSEHQDDDSLVNQWRPFQDEGAAAESVDPEQHTDDVSDRHDSSLGLADQLIGDIQAADSETEEESGVDQTSSWEPTHPFTQHDSASEDGFLDEAQGETENDAADDRPASNPYGWDQEYAEESRTSHWTNDVEGDHTEVIQSSSLESVMEPASIDEPPFEETPAPAEEIAEATSPESEPEAEEDDSIEAYMNRLLNRVQGTPGSDTSSTQSTPLVASSDDGDETQEAKASTTDVGATMPPIEPDAPLVPRSQAPERSSDLSAMRELANSSARSAVARSVRIQARDTQMKAMMKFAQAAIAGGCAVACYTLLNWSVTVRLIMVGAILVIAGILVQEGLVLLGEAKRRLEVAENGGDELNDDVDESSDKHSAASATSDGDP